MIRKEELQSKTNEELVLMMKDQTLSREDREVCYEVFEKKNYGLLTLCARRNNGASVFEEEDAIEIAKYAMLMAINKFDPSKGTLFSTFFPLVASSLFSKQRNPMQVFEFRYKKAYYKLFEQKNAEPTHEEIAAELGMPIVQYLHCFHLLTKTSMDRIADKTSEKISVLADIVPSEDLSPIDDYIQRESMEEFHKAIHLLSKEQLLILELHYMKNQTFEEIGKLLGVSKQRVEQKHKKILELLNSKLTEEEKWPQK